MKDRNCATVQDLLPEYVAATLGTEPAAEVRAHLAHCAECRAEAELVSLVRSADVDVPPDLESRIVSAMHAGGGLPSTRKWSVKHYAMAATVAFAAITGSWIWQSNMQGDENRPADVAAVPVAEEDSPVLLRSPGLSALSEEELLALLKEIES